MNHGIVITCGETLVLFFFGIMHDKINEMKECNYVRAQSRTSEEEASNKIGGVCISDIYLDGSKHSSREIWSTLSLFLKTAVTFVLSLLSPHFLFPHVPCNIAFHPLTHIDLSPQNLFY